MYCTGFEPCFRQFVRPALAPDLRSELGTAGARASDAQKGEATPSKGYRPGKVLK